MTGKTHQSIGALAVISLYVTQTSPEYGPATLAASLVASYFGSLLPDIDQPAGKLWSDLPLGRTVGRLADPFLEHRNITHSFLGFALVGVGMYFLTRSFPEYWGVNRPLLCISFMIAYASHLFADMFTSEGIPLLYPWHHSFGIPPKPFHGVRIMTGKWFENLVIFPLINIATVFVVYFNWDLIRIIIFK